MPQSDHQPFTESICLSTEEKRIILNELEKGAGFYKYRQSYGDLDTSTSDAASTASMISMIFRFFLQSGEYNFFVKRLKNVVASRYNADESMVGSIL